MKYTIIATIWMLVIVSANSKGYLNLTVGCAIVYTLFCIADEIKEQAENRAKQNREQAEQLNRTLAAIALDFLRK